MGTIESTRTNIVALDLGNTIMCMEAKKGSNTNLIVLSHECVLVVDKNLEVNPGEPFIKLAYLYNRHEQAYEEWLHIIGKMCKKECTSKYFDNPKMEEHLSNGKFPVWTKDIIRDIARTAVLASHERENKVA